MIIHKPWYDCYVYWHDIGESCPNPKSYEDFERFILGCGNTIQTRQVKTLLKRIPEDDPILFENVKDCINRELHYPKTTINKIRKQIKEENREKEEYIINEEKPKTKFSKEEIKQYEEWFSKSESERYEDLDKPLLFNIVGENALNTVRLIFHLKFADLYHADLRNRVNLFGDPSSGKSYPSDIVIYNLLPKERILIIDGGSDKIFRYQTKEFDFVYLREMRKDMNIIEDLKSLGDDNPIWQYVDFQQKETITKEFEKAGSLTTRSFEYAGRDYSDRSWNIISDHSIDSIKRIKNFRLEIRKKKLERKIEEKWIKKQCEFYKNAIRYLLTKPKLNVIIPYAKLLEPLFPDRLRTNRDVDKLPDLIESITVFNQNNREIKKYEEELWVISEFADLHRALRISKEYFTMMALDLDPTKKDIIDFMEENEEYTLREIHNYIIQTKKYHENTTRNKLKGLIAEGYISTKKKKGRATKYKLIKTYEKLDLDIDKIEGEIHQLVEQYKTNWEINILELEDQISKRNQIQVNKEDE